MPKFRDSGWLPIGTDGCGSYYIIPLRGDFGPGFPVVSHDHADEYNPSYIMASDLEHFVKFLAEIEVTSYLTAPDTGLYPWPFDKEEVIRMDPAILNFTGVPLPREA